MKQTGWEIIDLDGTPFFKGPGINSFPTEAAARKDFKENFRHRCPGPILPVRQVRRSVVVLGRKGKEFPAWAKAQP